MVNMKNMGRAWCVSIGGFGTISRQALRKAQVVGFSHASGGLSKMDVLCESLTR